MKIADMHCDTISVLEERSAEGKRVFLRENDLHLDLRRMRESGYLLQNFALFVDLAKDKDPWERVCGLYRRYRQELSANEDWIAPVYRFSDIARNDAAHRMSALLTVEEGGVCGGDLEKLKELYRMGVRMMTLTWNYPNELGSPHSHPDGLTERGLVFLEEMEALGMIVDVSHLSDAGFYQVWEHTGKPFVASHSNARSLCRHARNLTDDMIRKLAEKGGVIGLNFCADFLREASEKTAASGAGGVEDAARHARHIVKVGGIEVLGLGSDFDGIDTNRELPGVQSMERLWQALKRAGFSEGELDRIFSGNVLRLYEECLSG